MVLTRISFLGKANDEGSILVRVLIAAAALALLAATAGSALGAFAKRKAALERDMARAAAEYRAEAERCFGRILPP